MIPIDDITFERFIEYVLEGSHPNQHWKPYYEVCDPCRAHYSAIGQLETMDEDIKYILTISNLHKYVSEVKTRHATKNGSSHSWTEVYYSQLPCDLLMGLYQFYEIDFELFGYDAKYYFTLCNRTLF